ncbi:protein FAM98A [Orussus abietinus]|uniref:protein FAM98A n=1 Tax=Orussus abietinus TaxID=222816 RepID=UPI0006260C71|nr:protein FAM98A [Orussus abietinus]XP_012275573.1 protein FAM98A [Orussus abietinus]XP_012275574.1 protein FAM98A [Orussus abietinus]
METDILQNIQDLGYKGPLVDDNKLSAALDSGPKSIDFTGLVSWLSDQIAVLSNLEAKIHPTSSPEDASSFMLELSSFLKEVGCIHEKLTTGNINHRLSTRQDRIVLLEYLITELMTSKILVAKTQDNSTNLQVTINESDTAKCLKAMLLALKFQKPPENITPELLFKKLETKLQELVAQVPPALLDKPIFIGELSKDQWDKLEQLQQELQEEYETRRQMLLKRLDVTVQSFSWSDRIRPKEDQLNTLYQKQRSIMMSKPNVTLSDLLAARCDLTILEKTSNASVRKNTRSQINKVIIGDVPDRGGRPCEQEAPPPEMPSWQKDRVQGPSTFRGGRGGSGRGGGARGGGGGGGGRGGGASQGGYRDHKDATKNFGQNQSGYQPKLNPANYFQTSQSTDPAKYFQSYNENKGGGYTDTRSGGYSDSRSSSYSDSRGGGYSNNRSGGYSDHRGGGYSDNRGGSYSDNRGTGEYHRGGQRGGRVQGGWNQGGYNRGGRNQGQQGSGQQHY